MESDHFAAIWRKGWKSWKMANMALMRARARMSMNNLAALMASNASEMGRQAIEGEVMDATAQITLYNWNEWLVHMLSINEHAIVGARKTNKSVVSLTHLYTLFTVFAKCVRLRKSTPSRNGGEPPNAQAHAKGKVMSTLIRRATDHGWCGYVRACGAMCASGLYCTHAQTFGLGIIVTDAHWQLQSFRFVHIKHCLFFAAMYTDCIFNHKTIHCRYKYIIWSSSSFNLELLSRDYVDGHLLY